MFGSRARGNYKENSDWDILIVTKEKIEQNVKYEFIYNLRREIVWKMDIPVDIIVVDEKYFESYKNVYGSLVGTISLEGMVT